MKDSFLYLLFESYAIIDKGVSQGIRQQEHQKGRLACKKGCFYCCRTHKDIPVYPHELAGISWYVLEELPRSLREGLRYQLLEHKSGSYCPFLMDGLCSIHPLRPAACRLFNIFRKPCDEGEDPYYTRKEDVFIPDRRYIRKAFIKILPFYGLKDTADPLMAEDFIRSQAMVLQKIEWKGLGMRIRQ